MSPFLLSPLVFLVLLRTFFPAAAAALELWGITCGKMGEGRRGDNDSRGRRTALLSSPLCSHFYPLYAIMADGGSARKMNLESGGERKRVREERSVEPAE